MTKGKVNRVLNGPKLILPFQPPVEPMLAKLASELPRGESWIFEPKWDGFRALVFRSGAELYIQSRDKKPLGRYFPELEASLREHLPDRCVLDGEIVIAHAGRLDFDAMLQRIHPAASRVAMLAAAKPASYVAWDLLAHSEEDLRLRPQRERRDRLVAALGDAKPPIHITPATRDNVLAEDWFARFEGAGLDGVIAKPDDLAYTPGKRVMLKIKHRRTADCVVAGFRWYKGGQDVLVGSLLLGLFDAEGILHHVGVCAGFKRETRAELAAQLRPLRDRDHHPWKGWAEFDAESEPAAVADLDDTQRRPGATSRWNRGKDLSWEPLRLELVCEVSFDHLQGTRFRHGSHFVRWRPDKSIADCRYDQLEETPPFEIAAIFGS